MNLNDSQIRRVRQIIDKVYSSEMNASFLEEISPLVGEILDSHYFACCLFPGKSSPRRILISNNSREFVEVYTPLMPKDFLIDHLVETNSITVYSRLMHDGYPVDREFLEETQKVRPVSDGCYIPLKLHNAFAGFFAVARAGLNSNIFSDNDIELFNFICGFLTESFIRTFRNKLQDDSTALINGRGEILEQGEFIAEAFRQLFSQNHARNPCAESSLYEKIFMSRVKAFLSPHPLPGDGEFTIIKDGRDYHFVLTRLSSPPLRHFLTNEAQLKIELCREETNKIQNYLSVEDLKNRYAYTRQEHRIINMIYMGLSNKSIARELQISESTVKRHIWNIFTKTGVKNRTQLVFKLTN